DRRFAIYDSIRKMLSSVMTSGKAKDDEVFAFLVATRSAKWLLNSDIAQYLDKEVYHRLLDLQTLQAELEGVPVGDERTTNVRRQTEIKKWLLAQFDVLDDKFKPFLLLQH